MHIGTPGNPGHHGVVGSGLVVPRPRVNPRAHRQIWRQMRPFPVSNFGDFLLFPRCSNQEMNFWIK
jgi:hypothetical protein